MTAFRSARLPGICLLALFSSICAGQQEDPAPIVVKTVPDLVFAKFDGVKLLLDLHLPEGAKKPPLVISIHGGAWKTGDRKRFEQGWIARHGYAVASIEYRMSHEARFPAQIHDCKGAVRWLRAHQDEFGYDAGRIVVVGMSAGGHLATLLACSGGIAELEGATAGNLDQSSAVQGVIDYFGPTDFILRSKSQPRITEQPQGIVYQLLGGSVSENQELARLASPVFHVDPGDPPLLIIHGGNDPQVLPAQSQRLLETYQAAGLPAQLHIEPGKRHGWHPPTPEEQELVVRFLVRCLR